MVTNEKWKKINGFTKYEVSSTGKVRNIYNKQLKAIRCTKTGYCITDLKENGKKKTAYIHRLVAEAFIENPKLLPCVNHKDENKTNNCVENLEWCSVEYNNHYGSHNEKIKKTKIKKNGKAVKQIDIKTGQVLCTYKSMTEAAKATNITKQAIHYAITGNTHTAGGYRWVVVR